MSEQLIHKALKERIENNRLTDHDIQVIQNSDYKDLHAKLERKANEMHKEKKHLDRLYSGQVDWIKKDGTLVKQISNGIQIPH